MKKPELMRLARGSCPWLEAQAGSWAPETQGPCLLGSLGFGSGVQAE